MPIYTMRRLATMLPALVVMLTLPGAGASAHANHGALGPPAADSVLLILKTSVWPAGAAAVMHRSVGPADENRIEIAAATASPEVIWLAMLDLTETRKRHGRHAAWPNISVVPARMKKPPLPPGDVVRMRRLFDALNAATPVRWRNEPGLVRLIAVPLP